MSSGAGHHLPRVLQALAEHAAAHPFRRKLMVCRRTGVGRELLRALAAHGTPWINFEATTPLRLAHETVASDLAAAGLRVADEFDELTLLDEAMDAVTRSGTGALGEMADGVGMRQAVARSIQALRLAGIDAATLDAARFRDDSKREQVAAILAGYEAGLAERGLVDAADVLRRALPLLRDRHSGDLVLVLPGITARGLTGAVLDALLADGAVPLPAEPIHGLVQPEGLAAGATAADDASATPLSWLHDVACWRGTGEADPDAAPAAESGDGLLLDVFAASSVTAELREVLRRVMAAGLQWDEVEIVATDPVPYGVALDGLARRLGIPVSYAAGLPVARTRPGRAVHAYLAWLQAGMPAELLRRMLERGDIGVADVSGAALARRLRSLRVGHGRDRYLLLLRRRLETLAQPAARDDDDRSPEEQAADAERERRELEALRSVLEPMLATAPAQDADVSAAELAQGVATLLSMTPAADAADRTARARLLERLARIGGSLTRRHSLAAAAALLASRLEDRVPSPASEGGSPWTAAGGHLHLSDLEHGGWACRRATFVVGLDAGRFPGSPVGDALLVDEDRRRLAGEGPLPRLATAADRLAETRYAFAALAARLRGQVTFSYATWDAVEGRTVAPSSELLQAYRLMTGDPTADYETLHEAVAPAASAVPRGSALLDVADTWLHALTAPDPEQAGRRALRRGVRAVCDAYAGLGAGARAWKWDTSRVRRIPAGPHHGLITPRQGLDPRTAVPPRAVSASALQTLGTCPHRYLMRYVLRIRPPDDRDPTPEQWLQPMERGSLLHEVFEGTLRQAGDDDVAFDNPAFLELALRLLDDAVAATRERMPPPGSAVFGEEVRSLREDVLSFVAMVREEAPTVLALELAFGRKGAEPVEVTLADGSVLRLTGAIDRVDDAGDGLVIVDYKTGSSFAFSRRSGTHDGGRRLQHVLYAAAAERIFDRPVLRAEFHFPTRRSQNHRARYDGRALREGLPVVDALLGLAREGWFVPTQDAGDCSWCDYASVCRVRVDDYGGVTSPLAEWARESDHEAAEVLRRIRR